MPIGLRDRSVCGCYDGLYGRAEFMPSDYMRLLFATTM